MECLAKGRTLTKYFGRGFLVCASVGHILDPPETTLGVDVENDFERADPGIPARARGITELEMAAKNDDTISLAPDPDREGRPSPRRRCPRAQTTQGKWKLQLDDRPSAQGRSVGPVSERPAAG